MEEYLTAQEFADELEVTRQLIYYHAKKIPNEEKVYNDENRLVFTKEQQMLLKSFMTDTFDTPIDENIKDKDEVTKEESQHDNESIKNNLEEELAEPLDHLSELKRDFSYDPELAKQISLVLENERDSKNEKTSESDEVKKKDFSNNIEKNVISDDANVKDQQQAIRTYIEETVKEQLKEKWLKDEEERNILVNELKEKNKQINDLLQLVDQQQKLMLLTEKKNNHLIETIELLRTEGKVAQSMKLSSDENDDNNEVIKSKSWLQRLFS
ncbi:hypothetical protein [Facklamia sp. 7083-14-GEN3]|uniref:hypothetical protein n=1 Tax=Facklamia sp. 7083-14-GEN3 TaxID=2973478 RepID=UPI00215C1CEE|nr:hypothetical protein [Facklamia sp. 7083-14-GEN3]MCR8969858.1 hypothetical protein [Facklamia sp. 7083-14-GEN3]